MVGSKLAGVVFVISFFNSSNEYPTANFAAILAIGKPVAFEAKAEDLLTLGIHLNNIYFSIFRIDGKLNI